MFISEEITLEMCLLNYLWDVATKDSMLAWEYFPPAQLILTAAPTAAI